jgi:glycosyltransferase involved in cell wall biosynthesis
MTVRVLHLLASPGPEIGGMERQLATLVAALAKTSDTQQSVLAAPSYAGLFHGIRFLPCEFTRSRYHPLLRRDIRRAVHEAAPDLIHAHGHKAAMLSSGLKRSCPTLRYIATAHGTKRNNRCLRAMHRIIAVSQGVADALAPLPATVIPNAIPPLTGAPTSRTALCQQWRLDPDRPIVAAAGRLVSLKRYDALIRAVNLIGTQLIIFGDGPDRTALARLAGPSVRLAGHQEKVRNMLGATDLLVICSEREGMSLSMLEALQIGVPVLSTAVSGALDVLPEQALIRDLHPSRLAQQVLETLNQLEQLSTHLQPAMSRVRTEMSPESLARQVLQVYRT